MPFIIPAGDHGEEFDRYNNLMRLAMLQAGRKRKKFIEFKKAVKRCHIETNEPPETREILSQVNRKKFLKIFKNA